MPEPTEEQARQQISEALGAGRPIVLAPGPRELPAEAPPAPDEEWELPNGMAWVYRGEGNERLTRPVILADGFNSGPSELPFSWEFLENGPYPFISELRRRGRDVVLLGFRERSASIIDNAQAAQAAVQEAISRREGDAPLVVGGFSMGGLVTRYALADLERKRMNHQTALYFSYDSPHRGAWIPIGLQAFAHYIRPLNAAFSDQMNSPAAQQLLWQHISEWNGKPETHEDRTNFLAALRRVGDWPNIPRKIGVANGAGDGSGQGIRPGTLAFAGKGLAVVGTKLYTQGSGDGQLVGELRVVTIPKHEIRTPAFPEMDGAPGGTLEGFGILADALNEKPPILGLKSEAVLRAHCFVPAVSAVAIRDIDDQAKLHVNINGLDPSESELDEFKVASQNEAHTLVTEELCGWIIERLPQ
ncbi:hypothetical protein GCM10010252_67610 [Streptomyces aureoverticillatus]|nr:hypothetical protein GCM10010252_67610 [Streptomyces aureoverticillatus]